MNRILLAALPMPAIALVVGLALPAVTRTTSARTSSVSPFPPLIEHPSQVSQVSQAPTTQLREPTTPVDFLKQGVEKAKANDLEGAIAAFDQAIQLKRDYAAAYYYRGTTYANVGNPRAAIADYTQVILLKPNNGYVRYDRGLIRADLKDYKGAIEDFQQAAMLFKQQLHIKDQQQALEKVTQLQQRQK